jgi:hypothetical protein
MRPEKECKGGTRLVAVGEGQEQGHGGDAAEAGQDADHEAVDDADQHEHDGLRRQQGHQAGDDGLEHSGRLPTFPPRVPLATSVRSIAGAERLFSAIMTAFTAIHKAVAATGHRVEVMPGPKVIAPE